MAEHVGLCARIYLVDEDTGETAQCGKPAGHPRPLEHGPAAHDVSDGYHTFGELYEHRRALTVALTKALRGWSWRSQRHHPDDVSMFDGYFIVGVDLPNGTITYHYKMKHWDEFVHVDELTHAPEWDGAAPAATVERLLAWAASPGV